MSVVVAVVVVVLLLFAPAPSAASSAAGRPVTWHVCTMVRRDARFLPEWLEYHSLQGASSFTIYDHGSSDDARELGRTVAAYTAGRDAEPLSALSIELVGWPPHTRAEGAMLSAQRRWADPREGRWMRDAVSHCRKSATVGGNPIGCQVAAQADCVARFGRRAAFLSFTDTDEFFLAPPGGRNRSSSSSSSTVVEALSALKRDNPTAEAFYMPSTTFGSGGLAAIPAGALVVETFTRRAPFEELGDDAEGITASLPACSQRTRSFPDRTMCTVDHGKPIYAGRKAAFRVGGGGGDFAERFRTVPVPSVTVPRNGRIRLLHFQHRGLDDLAARGKLWGKGLNVEQARGAPEFWNAVEDRVLAGDAALIATLRERIKLRFAALADGGGGGHGGGGGEGGPTS